MKIPKIRDIPKEARMTYVEFHAPTKRGVWGQYFVDRRAALTSARVFVTFEGLYVYKRRRTCGVLIYDGGDSKRTAYIHEAYED
jgi:hypothetical protein